MIVMFEVVGTERVSKRERFEWEEEGLRFLEFWRTKRSRYR